MLHILQAEKDREICSSAQVFTMVVSQIERNQAVLVEKIQQKQEALERRAEECLKQLRKETEELQRRRSKLQYLANIEDPVHILQVGRDTVDIAERSIIYTHK